LKSNSTIKFEKINYIALICPADTPKKDIQICSTRSAKELLLGLPLQVNTGHCLFDRFQLVLNIIFIFYVYFEKILIHTNMTIG